MILDFAIKFSQVIFPTILILLFFVWFGRRLFRLESPLFFFTAFLLADFAIRLSLFFAGVKFQGRYLYLLAVLCCIFSAPGLPGLMKIASLAMPLRKRDLYSKIVFIAILMTIGGFNVGKAFHVKNDKKWISDISALMKTLSAPNRKPVLISSLDDARIAYYAGATFYKYAEADNAIAAKPDASGLLKISNAKWIIWEKSQGDALAEWIPFIYSGKCEDLSSRMRKMGGGNVFLLMSFKAPSLKPAFESDFKLTEVGSFTDEKGNLLSLYQADSNGNAP